MFSIDKTQYKKLMVGMISAGVLTFGGFKYIASANKAEALAPCIITISGVQYDVAPLTQPGVHPGGNIFTCGTDMTAIFMSMPTHAADLARLTPYIYNPITTMPTNTPTITPTNTPTVTPTITTSPVPESTSTPDPSTTITSSPSPSITPKSTGDDEHEEENEKEEKHHDKKKGYEKQPSNHGRTRASAIHNERESDE
ncbi:MAG: hypothetical protein U0525_04010 [Patescibacteria group bacterium]